MSKATRTQRSFVKTDKLKLDRHYYISYPPIGPPPRPLTHPFARRPSRSPVGPLARRSDFWPARRSALPPSCSRVGPSARRPSRLPAVPPAGTPPAQRCGVCACVDLVDADEIRIGRALSGATQRCAKRYAERRPNQATLRKEICAELRRATQRYAEVRL